MCTRRGGCTKTIPYPHLASLSPQSLSKTEGTLAQLLCTNHTISPLGVPFPIQSLQHRAVLGSSAAGDGCVRHIHLAPDTLESPWYWADCLEIRAPS